MVTQEIDNKMTEEDFAQQWEICGLYLMFAFQKVGEPSRRIRDNFGNIVLKRKINAKEKEQWR
jgi:hypothetical protein